MLNSSEIIIEPTKEEDIPTIVEMIASEKEALVPVDGEELGVWVREGRSFVARDNKGRIIGHQAIAVWAESGWIELRSAFVLPECRGSGTNTAMKRLVLSQVFQSTPNATMVGFTEPASKSRGILKKLNFQLIPLDTVPDEFFRICPASCYKKTGQPCGCEVYILRKSKED